MRSVLDAKTMARTLRAAMAERGCALSHGESLDLVARQFGLANWNVLAARIGRARPDVPELVMPDGWRATGHTDPELFRLGLDPGAAGVAMIACRVRRDAGIELGEQFAGFMQSVDAARFRGGRVRLAAELQAEDVDRGALWLRVDRAPGGVLAFDNGFEREENGALRGTSGWVRREIVLPVAAEAASVHLGFVLKGFGALRARGMTLDAVGAEVATTAGAWGEWRTEPRNLGFGSPGKGNGARPADSS